MSIRGDPEYILSDRQMDVARLSMYSLDEIAVILGIAPSTVKVHLRAARLKLRVRNKRELARLMAERGLLDIQGG